MSDLVRNPIDRFSHNGAHVTINDFHLASSVSRGRSIGDVISVVCSTLIDKFIIMVYFFHEIIPGNIVVNISEETDVS